MVKLTYKNRKLCQYFWLKIKLNIDAFIFSSNRLMISSLIALKTLQKRYFKSWIIHLEEKSAWIRKWVTDSLFKCFSASKNCSIAWSKCGNPQKHNGAYTKKVPLDESHQWWRMRTTKEYLLERFKMTLLLMIPNAWTFHK